MLLHNPQLPGYPQGMTQPDISSAGAGGGVGGERPGANIKMCGTGGAEPVHGGSLYYSLGV